MTSRVLIKTDGFPATERFAYFRNEVSRLRVPMDVHGQRPAGFAAELRSAEFGVLTVASLVIRATGPHEVRRTPALIRRSDPQAYRLAVNLDGAAALRQNGRDGSFTGGELALYDTSLPFAGVWGTDTPESRWVLVTFPRPLLPVSPSAVRHLLGVPLPGRAGIGAAVSALVAQIANDVDGYLTPDACRVSTTLLDLLAALFHRELGADSGMAPGAAQQVQLLQVQTFIQQRLGDPALSPDTIAAARHMSTRSLHRLFQAHGLSVADWIRSRRLERCRRDLADPLQRDCPIGAIAPRWGFTSQAHFSRVFRAAYGVSPLAFRLCHPGPEIGDTPTPAERPWG